MCGAELISSQKGNSRQVGRRKRPQARACNTLWEGFADRQALCGAGLEDVPVRVMRYIAGLSQRNLTVGLTQPVGLWRC